MDIIGRDTSYHGPFHDFDPGPRIIAAAAGSKIESSLGPDL